MGDAIDAVVPGAGLLTGKGPLAKALGLSGEQGAFTAPRTENKALDAQNARNYATSNYQANKAVEDYSKGGSLDDALNPIRGNWDGNDMNAITNRIATDPLSGSRMATDQVQNNGILGGLFGKGGTLNQAEDQYTKLNNQGFQLTPEDHEAYGQASGNIARMFGQSENNLSQSLADRGLAGTNSGAAGVGFSGLQGNKNEMLAKAQTDIANQRMQNTQQRLQSTQNFLSQMGQQGNTAIQDQYGRQLAGVKQQDDNLNNTAKTQIAQNTGAQANEQASLEDQRAAKGKTLLEGLGTGLASGVTSLGKQAPGAAVQGMAG